MLEKNFREFIALLEKEQVKYLVIGGHAVAAHGFPRFTVDLDIFIAINPKNAVKMLAVFKEFGFGNLALTEDDFLKEDYVVEVGREPLKIQVLTGIDGVTFDECYKKRITISDEGLQVPFIGLGQLLKNKAASARPKDRIDLEELKRLQMQQRDLKIHTAIKSARK